MRKILLLTIILFTLISCGESSLSCLNKVHINEVAWEYSDIVSDGKTIVEIYNDGECTIDFRNFSIKTSDGNEYNLRNKLSPGNFELITINNLYFDIIYLIKKIDFNNSEVIDKIELKNIDIISESFSRLPDGSGDFLF